MDYQEAAPVLRQGGRQNFWLFLCYMDFEFFYKRRRFLKAVAIIFQILVDKYLEEIAIKIALSMPPRSGKSYLVSMFCAYWFGRFPDKSVMRNCCTAGLYEEFSYAVRGIVKSDKFKEVFPELVLSKNRQNLASWAFESSLQCAYFGAGVNGNIIGKGANLAITDDLYSGMKDAMSDAVQATTRMWKIGEHDSRMERNCPEIFVGTRWTVSDVIGETMATGLVDHVISFSALEFVNGQWQTFCDDVKTTEEYIAIRDNPLMDEMTWLAEYQQEPIETKGLLLPKSELNYDTVDHRLCSYRFAVGDPANTGGDKFAVPFCGVMPTTTGLKVYVFDALCNLDGIMANTPRIADKCEQWGIEDFYLEVNGVGLASFVDIQGKLGNTDLLPFDTKSTENKEVRILSNFEFIRKFFVFPHNLEAEYGVFFADLTTYIKGGKNVHKKDAIDVLSRAAEIVKLRYYEEFYKK